MDTRCVLGIAWAVFGLLALAACDRKPAAESDHDHASHAGGSAKSQASRAESGPPAGRCPHDALKSDCFICDPSLRDKGRLWCAEHGRYEDRCFLCHPDLEEKGRAFCGKHFLYGDECFLCRPGLKQGRASAAPATAVEAAAIGTSGILCEEHGVPESECGICHPESAAGLQPGQGLKVRLASKESAAKGGVETGLPEADEGEGGPAFLGRVAYNGNRFAHIASLAPGIIQRVHADFGDEVKRGQPLIEIASPAIARAKSAYLSALSDLDLKESAYRREKELAGKNVSSRQEFEQAEAEYRMARNAAASARQELLDFGMPDADLKALAQSGSTSSTLPIRAPFAGTIIDRKAVPGEAVNPEVPLFSLGDLSTVWLELSLPPDAGAGIKVGDPVSAGFDALPGKRFPGRIIWVSPGIDGTSRMLKVRALVENPDGVLKDGMFGKARLPTAKGGKRLGLPSGAVQRIQGADFVFVKLEEDLYEARKVWLEEGQAAAEGGDSKVTLLEGLGPGEEVVLTGAFAMKTELLKSRLGAGCADH